MATALVEESEHDKRYDRQTRIWGAHGQKAIESAQICVLGAGPTSSETLKNLVLPNVGNFTLVDGAQVTQEDLGNNFFVEPSALGKSRAETVSALLLEMNPTVTAKAVAKDPIDVINNDISFFDSFTLVIASQLPEAPYRKLAAYLYERSIPLISLRSHGLIGTARLAVPQLLITETHIQSENLVDLHIHPEQLNDFPELESFVNSFAFGPQQDDEDATLKHSHIPYVAILIYTMREWMKTHDGKPPKNFGERMQFKELIKDLSWNIGDEENFQEAQRHASKVTERPELEPDVAELLESDAVLKLKPDSPKFFLMARAVREFIRAEGNGFAPVNSDIPDMTCLTDDYVTLKNIYLARARRDQDMVRGHVTRLAAEAGIADTNIPSDDDLAYFLKNFRGIRVYNGRSVEQEYDAKSQSTVENIFYSSDDPNSEQFVTRINDVFLEPEDDPTAKPTPKDLQWYFALRAVDRFFGKYGRYPGEQDDKVAADQKECFELQQQLFEEYGVKVAPDADCMAEIVRSGPSEIHNIAAFMGGVGAQIALKVILQQFQPLNNTLIFNGVHGRQFAIEL